MTSSYRPLQVDEHVAPRPPTRRRRTVILGVVVLLLVGVVGVGAAVVFWPCRSAPPGDVLDPLPPLAIVVSNKVGPDCARMIDLAARGGDSSALRADLVAGLTAGGWRLTDGVAGTIGTLPDGSGTRYWLRMSARPQLSIVLYAGAVPAAELPPLPSAASDLGDLMEPRFATGQVIALADRGLQAFDPATGAATWASRPCGGPAWATPFAPPPAEVVVIRCGDTLRGIWSRDGSEAWTTSRPVGVERIRVGGSVVTMTGANVFEAVSLADGHRLFAEHPSDGANGASSPNGVFASDDSKVRALTDDGEARWSYDSGASGLLADGDLVFARKNLHQVVALDASTGALRWTSPAEPSRLDWSEMAGVNEHVVVAYRWRDAEQVTVYDRATGARLWQRDGAVVSSMLPAIGGDVIVFTTPPSATGPGEVLVVDDRTGEELHRYPKTGLDHAAASGGRVAFVPSANGVTLELHDTR